MCGAGHLGEDTVEHTAYHLPIIVEEFLQTAVHPQRGWSSAGSAAIVDLLRRAISSFDDAIAGDVVNLFPGGMKELASLPDAKISSVLNDDGPNFKKARLCLYGTTALVALIDPTHEHLWCANLGDCQAALVTFDSAGRPRGELLSAAHNGSNPREVNRVRAEHPGEPEAVRDGRVLGVIGPFRCKHASLLNHFVNATLGGLTPLSGIGDTPFKLSPVFTRKVLYNLSGCGAQARAKWDAFLARSHTPPYISAQADVSYRHLPAAGTTRRPLLVLCTDGLVDLSGEMSVQELADGWSRALSQAVTANNVGPLTGPANLAVALLRHALGGDAATVSTMLSDELEVDDTTIIVATL